MPSHDMAVLQQRRVSESRDPDETREFMRAKQFHLDLHPREARRFDFAASALYLPNSYIGYIQYGSAATVRVPAERARNDYFIHLPLLGSAAVVNRMGEVVCDRHRGAVSSPTGHVMHAEAESTRITLSVTASTIVSQLSALLGYAPKQPLEFAPSIDLDSPAGQRISRQVHLAIADLEDPFPAQS